MIWLLSLKHNLFKAKTPQVLSWHELFMTCLWGKGWTLKGSSEAANPAPWRGEHALLPLSFVLTLKLTHLLYLSQHSLAIGHLAGFSLMYRQENPHFSEDSTGGVLCKALTCPFLWPASFLRKQSRIWILIQKFLKGWPPSRRAWGFFTVSEEIPWMGERRILSLFGDHDSEKTVPVLFTG